MTTRSGGRAPRARLGFVGLGWIGGLRLRAVADAGTAEVLALCDADVDRLEEWGGAHPAATRHRVAEDLLDDARRLGLDGLVIATPNALHAPFAQVALERGLSLFVQKPLGLHAREVADVLATARSADRLVEVDYSYRYLEGARRLREVVRTGDLGEIRLVEAVFHNAYGPDKAWCFDAAMSGGGALLDLGVHLLDLVVWLLGPSTPRALRAHLHDLPDAPGIDCFTTVELDLPPSIPMRMTCSWHAHAGRDCDFRLTLHGSEGAAELRNRDGGFYDFELVARRGRSEETVVIDTRAWMDRGILSWIERLRAGEGYDAGLASSLAVAHVVDAIHEEGRTRGGVAGGAPAARPIGAGAAV